jgi:hypothetical protein
VSKLDVEILDGGVLESVEKLGLDRHTFYFQQVLRFGNLNLWDKDTRFQKVT